jgi:ABC-type multidrug transport system fused ATPase/permease subunit
VRTVVKVAALTGVSARRLIALLSLGALSSLLSILPIQFLAVAVDVVAGDSAAGGGVGQWLRQVVNWAAPTGEVATAIAAVGGFAVASLVADAVRISFGYAAMRTTNAIVVQAKKLTFDQTLKTPATAVRRRSRGDMIHRVSSDPTQLESLYGVPLTTIGSDLLDVFWVIVVVAALRWDLALILVLPMPLIAYLGVRAARRQRLSAERLREADGSMTAAAEQTASNLMVVKSFAGEARESRGFAALTAAAMRARQDSNTNLAGFFAQTSGVRLTATGGLLCYAIYLVATGQLAIGAIAILVSYTTRFYSPLLNLSKSWQSIQRGLIAGERILELFNRDAEDWRESTSTSPALRPRPLRVEGLVVPVAEDRSISYPDISVAAGGLAVITGHSGGGKSTLLQAIMGYIAPSQGAIEVGDDDLASINVHDRRQLFSYAGQENFLHNTTVLDNVMYPESGDDQAEALRQLKALELADRAEDIVGEAGIGLSGGQARRVVLARALTRTAPILLLDEVFANLDPRSAELVAQAIRSVIGQRTVIMICHELPEELRDCVNLEVRVAADSPQLSQAE